MVLALLVIAVVSSLHASPPGAVASATEAPWTWPVVGPVVVPFDPPDSPYGAGHRGIDIAAPVGTDVVAPAAGIVSFAGPVGGRLFVTIDHGGGLLSTSSFLASVAVRRGDAVSAGQVVATTGTGHTGSPLPVLHFSVRLDDVYVDPLMYLPAPDPSGWLRLAPL